MKKFNLKKWKSEILPGLLTEQTGSDNSHKLLTVEVCQTPYNPNSTYAPGTVYDMFAQGWQCDGSMCNQNHIDQHFYHPYNSNTKLILKAFSQPTFFTSPTNLSPTTCPEGCTDHTANNYDPTAYVDNGSCSYTNTPPEAIRIIMISCEEGITSQYVPVQLGVCVNASLNPQVGDVYGLTQNMIQNISGLGNAQVGTPLFVREIGGPNACPPGMSPNGIFEPTPLNPSGCDTCCNPAYDTWNQISPSGACWNACQGVTGCPATCNSSLWSNHANWINNFTSLPNFTSTNPNQPCNMLCNKIQTWSTNCTNAGPNQQNMLACKIEETQNQVSIHGCSC